VAADSSERRPLWRFSLIDLLLLTTMIAGLAWLHTRSWRLDDLIVIALWSACVVAGITFNRRGGFGLVLAVVAGGIVPVTGFLAYHSYLFRFRRMVVQIEATYPATVLVTACIAAVSAALVVGLFALFDRQSAVVRKRIKSAIGLAVIGIAVSIVTLLFYQYQQSWHPILTVPIGGIDPNRPAPPPIAIAPNGSLLAVIARSPGGDARLLRIWDLIAVTERPPLTITGTDIVGMSFAPDGDQIAVAQQDRIVVFDTSTGATVASIGEVAANPWLEPNIRFSPDGKRLAVCRYDEKTYKALVWETANWTLLYEHEITEGMAQPVVADDSLALLRITRVPFHVTVVDCETFQPLYPARFVPRIHRASISNEGLLIGSGLQAIDLPSGKSRELAGQPLCLASGGRRYLTFRASMKGNRFDRLPDWRLRIPVVRHWWMSRMYSTQFVLLDMNTDQEVISSLQYEGERPLDYRSSDDGNVVVAVYQPRGTIRVWRVPE
jgi:hypothetical protein